MWKGQKSLEDVRNPGTNSDDLKGPRLAESIGGGAEIDGASAFQARMQQRVEQEVMRRRAEGRYPPSFEAKLRTIYNELVPKGQGASEEDIRHLIYSVDRSAIIDIDVPLQSQKPGVTYLKTFLRKLMAWYLNYLAQQLSNFHANLIQLLHAYDLRLSRLERQETKIGLAGARVDLDLDTRQLERCCAEIETAASQGRTLVTSCGSSELLVALSDRGCKVYGIDRDSTGLDNVAERGLDVRWDETLRHLEHVRSEMLDAIVLQGSDEVADTKEKIAIVQRSLQALFPGGKLAIVVHDPSALASNETLAVTFDLSPGKLFQPATWQYILQEVGFVDVEVIGLPRSNARKAAVSLVVGRKGAESFSA